MAHSTSRLSLGIPDGGDLESAYPPLIGGAMNTLDNSVIVTEGTISARPLATAVEKDRIYKATDTGLWYISNGANWNVMSIGLRGATNIATSQSTSSTTFTTLATPDQVTGIVLPANGLIRVWYQALWQYSAGTGSAQAAIFIGSNQLLVQGWDGGGAGHAPLPEAAFGTPAAPNEPLFSFFGGLASGSSSTAASADATTGQAVGYINGNGGPPSIQLGVQQMSIPSGSQVVSAIGGPCDIFASAGTYTISVQFKASAGSVTASNRKLWVQAVPFG